MEVVEGKVPAGDIEIAWKSVGEGEPLVVLHGGPGLGHGYMRGLDVLADTCRVIYYDQRGSGGTELGDEGLVSFSGAIADLDAVRVGLGLERISVIGHSFGGLLGLFYASRYPDNVTGFISYATAPPFVPEMAQRLWATMVSRRTIEDDAEKQGIEASLKFQRRDPRTWERYILNQYAPFFDERESRHRIDMGFTEFTTSNVDKAWERMMRDFETLDPMGSLGKINAPTLVVHCENDAVPEDFSRLLADKIENARYEVVRDTNHFAHVENPEALAQLVKSFMKELSA